MKGAGKTLVVLRFSALGDVAMTLPVIYSVARQWPGLKVYVATRPFFAKMFVGAPANVEVLPFDLKEEYKGFGGTLRVAQRLASLHPDYVADLHNMARTIVIDSLLRLTGARVAIVDKARFSRRKVYAGGESQRQYIFRYFDVFARLGLEAPPDFTSIFDGANVSDGNDDGPDADCVIKAPAAGIAPFARYATKTYPPEMMREAAQELSRRGINVYLFGGRGAEAAVMDSWQQPAVEGCGEIVSLAGRFPLEKELKLMSSLGVMVSMDSANQHLASIAGCQVLTVWGGTSPACGFRPWGASEGSDICLELPCQPCSIAGTPECPLGTLDCMRQLTPSHIAEAVVKVLTK